MTERTDVPIAQIDIKIPKLIPEIPHSNGSVLRESNLKDLADEAGEIFNEKPWFRPLSEEIEQHKKSATFVIVLGGISIFVAASAGFEFGIRHGKDIKDLIDMARKRK